jgi:serine/threonine protein kinase
MLRFITTPSKGDCRLFQIGQFENRIYCIASRPRRTPFSETNPLSITLVYDLWYKKETPLTEEVSRSLIRQLLSALEFMHFHGIVHRDVKPANLLVTDSETMKRTQTSNGYLPFLPFLVPGN